MTVCRSCGGAHCFLWAAAGGGVTEPLCFGCYLLVLKVMVWRGLIRDERPA